MKTKRNSRTRLTAATLLLALGASLALLGCRSRGQREVEVVEPSSHDAVVRDQVPAEGSRKIPVVQKYKSDAIPDSN